MAGRGSRLRPHTLTIPKPLIPIAGKPIVHRLVEDIAAVLNQSIDEVAFIIHESFGKKVEEELIAIAQKLGAKGTIYYQNEALGTGHAIMCAKDSLSGPAVIAYADTLIRADFDLDKTADSVIWVKQVDQPEAFGVINLNENNEIVELVEKPKEFVSDLAVIGIYYFKDVAVLKNELQSVLDNNIIHGGEKIVDPNRTRLSQVNHFFFSDCIYYSPMISNVITGEYAIKKDVFNIRTNQKVQQSYNGENVRFARLRDRKYAILNYFKPYTSIISNLNILFHQFEKLKKHL